ncbi:MAG: glycosyltransferase family 4 protein [Actinobacteria bacterium]|nr:glycosyltransferase family 4 protein [Actinomycetota bacterium]
MTTNAPEPAPTVFITASVPMSVSEEAFVQDELEAMRALGHPMVVVPIRRHCRSANAAAVSSGLASVTLGEQLLSLRVIAGALLTLARSPIAVTRALWALLLRSGGRRNLLNNLASTPKALWVAREVRRRRATHVHSYWLGHTATVAWIAHKVTGVPWSGTGYRWDIDAENLFAEKLPTAAFVRCADELGHARLRVALLAHGSKSPLVLIRTGVQMPAPPDWVSLPVSATVVCCVGAFVPKKAQDLLVRAFAPLRAEFSGAELHLFGEGDCEPIIRGEVERLGLGEAVVFHGTVPLDELRSFLSGRPVTVLPSIVTTDGQQEGIPVTLIEAMAHGSPVVSTRTGSIPSLVTDGAGVLLEPGNVADITTALIAFARDPSAADQLARTAYRRVQEEFDLSVTAATLVDKISGASP